MRLCTREQAQEIDKRSQQEYLLSAESLMEAAGSLAAREISNHYFLELPQGATFVCGPGNNGADAMVVAKHLSSAGYRNLKLIVIGDEQQFSSLNQLQLDRLKRQFFQIIFCSKVDAEVTRHIQEAKLIVDGLYGVGLSRDIQGLGSEIIQLINSSKAKVISLDIPSGLDSTTGQIKGEVVRADRTLCFGLIKTGCLIRFGPEVCGKLRALPIGFPWGLTREIAQSHFGFTRKLARRYLPYRSNLGHKAKYGHLLVLAGSPGMYGAGLLSARAASRIGAGYVTLANYDTVGVLKEFPEFLTLSDPDSIDFDSNDYSAIVVGPGFGLGEKQAQLMRRLLKARPKNVILDADAISLCLREELFPLPSQWVLTPHAGELSRLLGISTEEIEADRFRAAQLASEKTGAIVLLKGFHSIISNGRKFLISLSGNGALSKAGTGDVLSGYIGGLMAQGVSPLLASATSSYLHGAIADRWVQQNNEAASFTPHDLIESTAKMISELKVGFDVEF